MAEKKNSEPKETRELELRQAREQQIAERNAKRELDMSQLAYESKMNPTRVTDDDLRALSTTDDTDALMAELFGDVIDVTSELGTGFAVLKDKDKLVGTAFDILYTRVNEGDFGRYYVSMLCIERSSGAKWIVHDGSSGIADQMRELIVKRARFGGFRVPNGLRKSDYDTCLGCGKPRPDGMECTCGDKSEKRGIGHTYYLDLTPAR